MIRHAYEDTPIAQWSEEEVMHHLTDTFDRACRMWPDIMEPYVVDLADAPADHHKEIMRRGLRDTVKYRYGAEAVG